MDNIYLDNAATTKIDPEVFNEMIPFLTEQYGNPASKYYSLGRFARAAVNQARRQIGKLIGAEIPADEDKRSEIIFTSCATESNNTVLKTAAEITGKRHIISSTIEHHAVLETLEYLQKKGDIEYTLIPVDSCGVVDPEDLKKALQQHDTAMVSIMLANNEVGSIQPIKKLAQISHAHGALFHTDAVQAAGKIKIDVKDLDVDFLSLSSHKFYGPKGVGILFAKHGVNMISLIHGGAQEGHRRAGTLNVASIVGMGKAAELAQAEIAENSPHMAELVERLWDGIAKNISKVYRNGNAKEKLPNILNVRFNGAEGEAILLRLDMFGIQVSSGSACSTDSIAPSHVLLALGIAQEDAHGSIRFSLSKNTTALDIDRVIEILPKQIDMIRQMSVTWNG